MIRNRILLKTFAVFFIVEMVISSLAPAVSWALTAGPTAPEATSFEPVDTTDVVDLKTGDFVYNVPLLEVPGPAGGYPISLSYHAGILPDQEASWTGLGFTLNTGSIFRMVNGYPDDHNGVNNVDRSFWKGGNRDTKEIGLTYGFANGATVGAGLTFANDTYKGSGVGGYISSSMPLWGPIGASSSFGISPYGKAYASAGVAVGLGQSYQMIEADASVGLMYNSGSGFTSRAGANVNAAGLGASIASDNTKGSFSVGGISAGVYNSMQDHVSTSSCHWQFEIPIYYTGYNLKLGRDYSRYWIDETAKIYTFGAIYASSTLPGKNNAFDTYDLLDTEIDVVYNWDQEKVLGGSLPDVDIYSVMAQGVSGNIKPYSYQGNLFRQEKDGSSGEGSTVNLTKSISLSTTFTPKPAEFRFINDFSNRFNYTPDDFKVEDNMISFDFEGNIVTGENGTDGYDPKTNHLVGSKHIEWYSNEEILTANPQVNPMAEGFIDCTAEGFVRESNDQIGGYSITNSSGVTYHFALPAYSYDEYMKSLNSSTKAAKDGERWNSLKKPTKYAYTWFLTSITGPDFIDKNENGLADHDDWGYWVNFEYKKWLGDYKWRNPDVGTNKDLDSEFENFSYGKKEIYYLDKVVTQSHVAIFEKSPRIDGREVSDLEKGGFDPIPYEIFPKQTCITECLNNCEGDCAALCNQDCAGLPNNATSYHFPRPSLKLDRIKLYNYADFVANHLTDDYLIRKIEFGYDYSLATGTPNSYQEGAQAKEGKLTLKTLSFLGKKGVPLIPKFGFEYKNLPYEKSNGETKVDIWGYWKSDFTTEYRDETNDILGRLTTNTSALDVDNWSLTKVSTALGSSINIEYESDEYNKVVLEKQQLLRTKTVTDVGQDKLKITFWEQVDLSKFLKQGDEIGLNLVGTYVVDHASEWRVDAAVTNQELCEWVPAPPNHTDASFPFSGKGVIEELDKDEGFVIVNAPQFYNTIKFETKIKKIGNSKSTKTTPCAWYTTQKWEGSKAYPEYFPCGVISFSRTASSFGGGLRVKSITIDNPRSRVTRYTYINGTTSYEPFRIAEPKVDEDYKARYGRATIIATTEYKKALMKHYAPQLNVARQLPGPGVMYQKVQVRESNVTPDGVEHLLPNYSVYEFETYQESMVDIDYSPVKKKEISGKIEDLKFENAYHRKVSIKDYSSRVGNLKSITLFDDKDAIVSYTGNNYLHDNISNSQSDTELSARFNNQGVVQETFDRARLNYYKFNEAMPYVGDPLLFAPAKRTIVTVLTSLETFPTVQTSQTNINYKTGIRNDSKSLAFDFYSGAVTQTLTTDSYGNKYLSVSVPVHKRYGDMGSKVINKANKNMLTQNAEQYLYMVKEDNAPVGLLSASIQTWSNQISILDLDTKQTTVWRPHSTYQWNGQAVLDPVNGTYPYDDFSRHPFTNWQNKSNQQDINWEKTSEITLYDKYSHDLEAKDINNNYAANRMNKDQTIIIASAANARYNEIVFAGAEPYEGHTELQGSASQGQGNVSAAHAHTGQYSLLVDVGETGFSYTLSPGKADLSKKYRASVWVYAPGLAETQAQLDKLQFYYTIAGEEKGMVHPVLQKNKSKSWYLMNLDITPNGTDPVFIGVRNQTQRGIYFDDFRVQPLTSSLTSYVYDSFTGELNFILDANNFYTRFEYDAMGRLIRTSKELLNFDFGSGKESFRADAIVNEIKYNYGKNH